MALLLTFTLSSIFAQGICDSIISINPIEDICLDSYTWYQITASHPGGVFSGPYVNEYGVIAPQDIPPGTYEATYTISTDSCEVTATENFTVLDRPEANVWSSGAINCTNPGSSAVELFADYNGPGFAFWTGPNGFESYDYVVTVNYGGTYYFNIDDPNFPCESSIPVVVDQIGAAPVNIINCGNCSGNFLTLTVDNNPGTSLGWYNLTNGTSFGSGDCFFVFSPGLWQVVVTDTASGCTSTDFIDAPSTTGVNPSVNAGSNFGILCNGTTQLNGAYNNTDWDFDVEWTTPDGSFVGSPDTINPYIDAPGTYYLTVTNPTLGCSDTDSVIVIEATITNFLNDTICAEEFSVGYNMTGTYIDTFITPSGCDSIRILDLIVYDSIGVNTSVIDENGMGNGVVILEVTGEAPFVFEWSTGEINSEPFLSGLSEGSYTVTITSENGCDLVLPFEIGLDPLTGGATTEVNGVVFFDENNNCIYDSSELTLPGVHVALSNGPIYAQNSNLIGEYTFPVSTGEYYLTATPPSSLWAPCTDSILVSLPNDFDTLSVNYPMQALILSPVLHVEIAATSLRRCFENTYTIQYENNGTAIAEDAYVEIFFDDDLDIISSNPPWSSVTGNTYRFDLGNIGVGESGSFTVVVIPNCSTTMLGDIICVEAHIFPDSLPMLNPDNWDGALITVDGECVDDELMFRIKNVGVGDMLVPNTYIVIEDAILNATDQFQLISGGEEEVNIPGNGATFWLRAEQVENAPADFFPGYAIEGCAADSVTSFSTGYMNDFVFSDLGQVVDTDCRQVVGAYDPNQKVAFPQGFSENHYIEPGLPIEYMIEFQNTGTDTAFTVEIVDVLAEELDLNTLEVLNSSHDFYYRLVPGRALTFTFENILLPDSTTNELASHGFVKFIISPKDNLEAGTVIENDAAIYFDFNDPIITDQIFHTIWDGNVFEIFTSTESITESGIEMIVFPNPFSKTATIQIDDSINGEIHFQLYDVLGKLVYEKTSYENQFEINPDPISAGIYFFTISNKDKVIASGKVMAN